MQNYGLKRLQESGIMGLKPSGGNQELWAKSLHETRLGTNYGLKASRKECGRRSYALKASRNSKELWAKSLEKELRNYGLKASRSNQELWAKRLEKAMQIYGLKAFRKQSGIIG
jgi:hypothetical protein